MNWTVKNIPLLLLSLLLLSCEEVIKLDLPAGPIQLVVSGNVTDRPGTDTVKLYLSQPYLDSSDPPAITDALVILSDNQGYIDTLQHTENGIYLIEEGVGTIDYIYTLDVFHEGQHYKSVSRMFRPALFDSLVWENRTELFGNPAGKYLNLYAADPEGEDDCYRFKYWINDKYFERAQDIQLAYDAAFSKGTDGERFIFPIREAINFFKIDDTEKPFDFGDKVKIEIWSIGTAQHNFWTQLQTQVTNNGLFATPPVNVPSNIINTNPGSGIKAVGWFGASAVVTAELTITEP